MWVPVQTTFRKIGGMYPVTSLFIAITRGITNAYSFSMNQAITTAKNAEKIPPYLFDIKQPIPFMGVKI